MEALRWFSVVCVGGMRRHDGWTARGARRLASRVGMMILHQRRLCQDRITTADIGWADVMLSWLDHSRFWDGHFMKSELGAGNFNFGFPIKHRWLPLRCCAATAAFSVTLQLQAT